MGCNGQSHCPMGWDGQWDTHASVEDRWTNVPLSHGTVGWDGQFTVFLERLIVSYHFKAATLAHSSFVLSSNTSLYIGVWTYVCHFVL